VRSSAQASASVWLMARIESALALALMRSGALGEADSGFQRAIAAMRELGATDALATTLINHAVLLGDQRRWQASYAQLLLVERLERQHHIRRTVPWVQGNLGIALIELGQPEAALRHLARAIESAVQLDQRPVELGALGAQIRAWLALRTAAGRARAEDGLRTLLPRCLEQGHDAALLEAMRAFAQYQAGEGRLQAAARTCLTVLAQPTVESGLRQDIEESLARLALDKHVLEGLRRNLPPVQALAEEALAQLGVTATAESLTVR
jgi:tetratricopeptide (TPR) repeat protein